MITFPFPWLLALLPLPFILARLIPEYRSVQSSIRIPRLQRLAGLTGQEPSSGSVVMKRSTSSWIVLGLVWVCAVVSFARPQLIGEPITRTTPSRDLLLAVDLSGSMNTEDFTDVDGNQVNRLVACKQVLDDFLTRREGDRVGLIFFGTAAFVQAPFTEDLELCRTLLDEAQVGMAGPQTVIGDAVGLALTVFERSEQDDRVLIVLTDGNDTGSKVAPQEAAKIAKDKGVTIYTIAVGDPQAVGEEKIDEEVLQDMASQTGGGFYRADDQKQLEQIYSKLDALATQELESESYLPKTDLFYWPLGAFLGIGLIYHGFFAAKQLITSHGPRAKAIAAAASIAMVMLTGANGSTAVIPATGFHFLRPFWLLILFPVALIVIAILKRQDARYGLQGLIDPPLLKHLLVQPESARKFGPIQLLACAWFLAAVGLAGPTWQREPSPFANDQAVVIFVQEVTPSMLAQDIQPSRLQRSVHKIRDLLALRPGTDSALIAYSGSAHLVMPITSDANIIESFAGELDPGIMPREGDAVSDAIQLASEQFKSAGRPGSVVLITDGIDTGQNQLLERNKETPVHILAIAGDQSKPLPLDSPPAPAIDVPALEQSAQTAGATLTVVTADNKDVNALSRYITTSFVAAQQDDGGERWKDMGYWLTPMVTLIAFFWFRPGWMVKWE